MRVPRGFENGKGVIAAVDRVNRDERLAPAEGGTYIVRPAEAVTRALDNECRH